MSRKAGVISIDVTAGTAKMVVDLEKGKAALREFGNVGNSSMRTTNASLRALEGNFANNNRAAAAFINTVLGGGQVLQYAFPIVGAVAFAGVIEQVGQKAISVFRTLQNAPEVIAGKFRELNQPLHITNDELRVANDRLQNDIAKLEGKRENTLKLALDQARLAADKLAESLDKDLASLNKLLKEQAVGGWQQFFGKESTSDIQGMSQTLRESTAKITEEYASKIANATSIKEKDALRTEENTRLLRLYKAAVDDVNVSLTKSPGVSALGTALSGGVPQVNDPSAHNASAIAFRTFLREQIDRIGLNSDNDKLTGQKDALALDAEKRKAIQAELVRLQEQLNAAQQDQKDGLAKINAEEWNELYALQQRKELTPQIAALIKQVYDAKRLNEYTEEMRRLTEVSDEFKATLTRIDVEGRKVFEEDEKAFFAAGSKAVEQQTHEVKKLIEEFNRLNTEIANLKVAGAVALIGIHGRSQNPVTTLAQQQAVERQAIQERYQQAIELAEKTLQGTELTLAKGNAERQRTLELDKLDLDMAEKRAEVQQKTLRDFQQEASWRSKSGGQIGYDAASSGVDLISAQLTKLITGQKTDFGKSLKQLGEQTLQESIKSGLLKAIGASKRGDSPAKPLYVQNVGGASSGEGDGQGDSGDQQNPLANLVPKTGIGGFVGGLLGKLFHGASSSGAGDSGGGGDSGVGNFLSSLSDYGGAFAEGGDVTPDHSYVVGEDGWEVFTPRTAGTITPQHKLGGGDVHFHYAVDARGAEIGVEERVGAAIVQAHDSAVATSVQAIQQHQARTPARQRG